MNMTTLFGFALKASISTKPTAFQFARMKHYNLDIRGRTAIHSRHNRCGFFCTNNGTTFTRTKNVHAIYESDAWTIRLAFVASFTHRLLRWGSVFCRH